MSHRRLLLLALAVFAAGAFVPPAHGSVLLTSCGGQWCHQHARTYTYAIDPSVPKKWADAIVTATSKWSERSTVLTLQRVLPGAANITFRACRCGTGPNAPPIGRAIVPLHAPATVTFNLDRLTDSLVTDVTQRREQTACHETGHALGLGHGGTGCMATNRQQNGCCEQPGIRLPLTPNDPGADDIALLDRTYPQTGH